MIHEVRVKKKKKNKTPKHFNKSFRTQTHNWKFKTGDINETQN